ncbi:hypothetical protein [Plantactinospora endophytica]|uniref:Uncharacterized protein n=1 Tax=Plantactinospora endophytica TaxID=673535 RepID=A0ABQ4DRP5_9ACTN|nr:hypothetical protein [Plantactinospora endophytica]GIG85114.1 hypothetical protein Pen02_00500 [Plantactinospora endophytica]
MTASTPDHGPRDQHNHSSGIFVGRDLNIETLDAKTKALLAKLSKDAPALANLLATALRDGVISPDVAFALGAAARSINEDVASLLYRASRCINEDVAHMLRRAGESINPEVAQQISTASTTLEQALREFTDLTGRIRSATSSLRNTSSEIREWERVADAMDVAAQNMAYAAQAQESSTVGWSWKSFGWGAGVCLFAIITILVLWTAGVHK